MKRFIVLLLAILLCAAFSAGCMEKQGAVEKSKPSKSGDEDAVAWVNGKPILKKAVDEMIATMPPAYQSQVKTPQGMKMLVDNMINVELVYDKALKEGFNKKPEVQDKIKNMTKQIIFASYIDESIKNSGTDEAAMRKFYEENKSQFAAKDQVQASHILFKTAGDGSDEKAKSKSCEEALAKAKKPNADFAALAKEYSDDSSKDNGGDLGFFEKDRMVKPFGDVAFEMKVGEVKGCVKTRFGYHIIKKTAEKGPGDRSFEEVKDQIAQGMKRQNQQKAYEDFMKKIKENAKIKYNEKLLGPISTDSPSLPSTGKKIQLGNQ